MSDTPESPFTNPLIGTFPEDTLLNVQSVLRFLQGTTDTFSESLDTNAGNGLKLVIRAMQEALVFELDHRPTLNAPDT